ncbi:MAG: GNAT family N-acetyltransferase [Gemmatimonadetes bacterium]|nr:GNAT family N-acetyltransferase [Gemmatimonadota bacterium]
MIAILNPIIEAGVHTIMQQTYTEEEQIAYIRDFPARGVFYVALANDGRGRAHPAGNDPAPARILGMQSVEPIPSTSPATFAHVGDISTFVAPVAHRTGVGRALSHATIKAAWDAGFHKIMAGVRADNPGAVAFYRSVGFRLIGTARRHARVRDRWIDEVMLEMLRGEETTS